MFVSDDPVASLARAQPLEAVATGEVSEQQIRDMRILMAHGTMVGKQPDVIAGLKRYNIIVPMQILRALTDEPAVIDMFYGPEGYEFLAPMKSLIDAGVRVINYGVVGLSKDEAASRKVFEFAKIACRTSKYNTQ